MNKANRIITKTAFAYAVYMLVLFIFLSLCIELQWTFIYKLPEALNWILSNVLLNIFKIGAVAVPVLTGTAVLLSVIAAVKEKSAKKIDIPFLVTTVIFTLTTSIISAIDTSVVSTFS